MHTSIKYLISGFLIGCANVVPGVSGGTIAVTLGVYRKIIESLSPKTFVTSFMQTAPFLGTVAIGMGLGVVAGGRIIGVVLEQFPLLGTFFFIGLIVGGLPVAFRRYRAHPAKAYDVLLFLCGVVGGAIPKILHTVVQVEAAGEVSLLLLILSGFVAAMAMVLPGLSGSLVLLIFGTYAHVISAINRLDIAVLTVFALSALAGVLCCARLMREVFKKMPRQTWVTILGVMVGSVVLLWAPLPDGFGPVVVVAGIFLIGLIPAYLLSSARSA